MPDKAPLSRLNGWQRIGLILSVAWAIAMVANAASQYGKVESIESELGGNCPTLRTPYVRWYDSRQGSQLSVRHDGEGSIDCRELSRRARELAAQIQSGAVTPSKNFAYSQLALVVVVPIVALWVFAYLAVWLFMWVHDGFRRDV